MTRPNERLAQLERRLEELESRNPRNNLGKSAPGAEVPLSGRKGERSAETTVGRLLDGIDDALTELDENNEQGAYETLSKLLDKYDVENAD